MRCTFFRLGCLFILSSLVIPASYADEYRLAVRAHRGEDAARLQWQATLDALNKALPEHNFTLVPIVSLPEITKAASRGEFEFLLTNPSSYVEVSKKYGARAIATLNNRRANTAQSRFGSVIFTHVQNTDILDINDIEDKTLIAVSETAFGGWRVAWYEMLSNGFDPYKQSKSVTYTKGGTQPEVVEAVLFKQAEVGVVRTDQLERMEQAGRLDMRYLRVLNNKDNKNFPFFLSTALYPEWPLASMDKVPADVVTRLQQVLLKLGPASDAAEKGKYVGWVKPLDYKSVDDLMRKLGVGHYKT